MHSVIKVHSLLLLRASCTWLYSLLL